MYKSQPYVQISFEDFNQPLGLHMNPENRWVKKAEQIPWGQLEKDYAKNFPNPKGNVAKSLRMALGALLIQKSITTVTKKLSLKSKRILTCNFSWGCLAIRKKRLLKPLPWSTFVSVWMKSH
ncbi:hypothetical protein GCM10025857_48690 [Alicyclobacillus contaminans]|nr:hypothetical protein GCM10025857_48690 [Alicyclobacillus contaminans]